MVGLPFTVHGSLAKKKTPAPLRGICVAGVPAERCCPLIRPAGDSTVKWATGFAESTSLQRRPWIRYFLAHAPQPRTARRDVAPSYRDWRVAAGKALERDHGVAPAAIPERIWTQLYIRRLDPRGAAARAATEYNNTHRPKGKR